MSKRVKLLTPNPADCLPVKPLAGESKPATVARTAAMPTVHAAITARQVIGPKFGGESVHLGELINTLDAQARDATSGNLARSEEMLVAQSHTLDQLFNALTRRALNAELMPHLETYMKLALRAQAQCRANAEALNEMKNPRPVAFVQQANIANGPQQVNNGTARQTLAQGACSRAEKIQDTPNELLEASNGERLDIGARDTAGGADPAMATLGEIHRAEVRHG
ncbi:MAG TPA: hypothetical protein VMV25_11805 [Steroidobacteraceae bacterium]|nr:hypothetical protein [Steroidobacteraceae bacterium]